MGYVRGDSFPFNFELNGNPFGSKSEEKLSPRTYPIKFERKWNTSFLSAACEHIFLEGHQFRTELSLTTQIQNSDAKGFLF